MKNTSVLLSASIISLTLVSSGCGAVGEPPREGRGCPIPYGKEDGMEPKQGSYLEMYATHFWPLQPDHVRVDIRPGNDTYELQARGSTLQPLLPGVWYRLELDVSTTPPTLTLSREQNNVVIHAEPLLNFFRYQPKGDPNVLGYRHGGITIYSAEDDDLSFGLRVKDVSVPITITKK